MQSTVDSMEASAESRTSIASGGSDEVFDDSTETGKSALDIEVSLAYNTGCCTMCTHDCFSSLSNQRIKMLPPFYHT